ncbi:18128_t:CDS:10, partial [Gigaspora margarita]
ENSKPKNFFSNIVKRNISKDISKKLTLILTETFTIDYGNLEMQQQIQRFLEEYFENPKSSNKETIEKDLIRLTEVLNQTWENIETAIIAAAKKTVPYLQIKKTNRISAKYLLVEVWNNQIRCINHLAETKVNKFPHSREDLEGWLTEAYTWRKAMEGKLTTESERVKKRPFNKVLLDRLLVKGNDQISSAMEPEEVRNLTRDFFQKQFYREGVENNSSNSKWDEVYSPSINKEEKKRLDLEKVAKARHAVLTYANDTTWIASSKEQLTQILELANEFYQLNGIKDIWQYQDNKLDEKVWHSNVAINTIEQCKNLDLIFDMVKIARGANCRDKVPLWFQKLEELLIDNAKSHKVKEDFFSNDINNFALQSHCRNITSDNRCKQWIWFTQKNKKKWLLKCGGCNLNTKDKENGCIISCNKNLIRVPFNPVQECPLLQLKEIDYAERELVKSQNFAEKVKNLILENLEKNMIENLENSEWYLSKKNECYRDEEHIWLELEARAISLAWAHLKDETRAVITREIFV